MENLWISTMFKEGNALPEDQRKSPFTRKTKAGEKVLGTVDPKLRGLVHMAQKKREAAEVLAKDLMANHLVDKPHDESACETKMFELSQLKDDADLLIDVFWNEVRHSMTNLVGLECITVTDDWNIVVEPVRERPSGLVMVSLGAFGLRP